MRVLELFIFHSRQLVNVPNFLRPKDIDQIRLPRKPAAPDHMKFAATNGLVNGKRGNVAHSELIGMNGRLFTVDVSSA
jgi:hypothetical protein